MEKITWEDLYPAVQGTLSEQEFRRLFAVQSTVVDLGERIRLARKAQNLTQGELAERAGTSQSAITRFEKGAVGNVTLSFLARIADGVGMSILIR